ncbi:MAG: prepilin-type N-terminal cleavage/methylation domain-containing protein [candidate division Zixibacteria bacterium]|nr:prepilin-type N-terminal cleavage/methylation domain-containing protein [candidate division Zixibacteria bacterium]
MSFAKFSNHRGFTLIELAVIIAILGILVAVAIPKYSDLTAEAKAAACKGAIGGLRSGISIYYATTAVKDGTASWPTLAKLRTIDTVMVQAIPPNPYISVDSLSDSIVVGVTKGTVVAGGCGWAYLASTGEIWSNTASGGSNTW